MPLDYDRIRQCLDEIEAALFSVADSEECQKFHRDSQLSNTWSAKIGVLLHNDN